jgi:hypothetical protein
MARTIQQIQSQIIATKNAQPSLNGLNSPSQTAIWNLWTYIMAVGIFIQEGLWDLFETNLEVQISNAPAWTDQWVQAQSFLFQYNATIPQIVQLNNFVPSYKSVNVTDQIISRASVTTLGNRDVSIKLATQNPPQALSTSQLTSFQGYLDIISPAGVQYNAVSYNPDQLMVGATVWYDGQYASQIQNSVITAINTYMANIPFNGYIRLSSLETSILNIQGVNDVELNNIALRPDSIPFSGTTYLVQNDTEIFNKYPMFAGYVISEQTSGYTINNTLTFIVGS